MCLIAKQLHAVLNSTEIGHGEKFKTMIDNKIQTNKQ